MNKRRNVTLTAGIVIGIFLLATLMPVQGAITYGRWRNINPTQYASAAAVGDPLRGVYVRNGGSGSIGAGDGWAVGGTIANGPLIAHYDGFSWQIMASPVPGAEWNSVHFCTNPGAPGVGLCSPNGDGSDGWIVGTAAGAGAALYCNAYGSCTTIVTNGLAGSVNLTSVFMACHSPQYGSGCPGSLAAGLTYAVGSDATGGAIWAFNGNPLAGGGWTLSFDTADTTQFNSVYLFIDPAGNLGGFAVGNSGVVARLNGGTWTDAALGGGATDLLSVFVDQGNPIDAWAVGRGGQVWHFSNGFWAGPTTPGGTSLDLTGIALTSTSEGWIVGQDSAILHSTTLGSSNVWAALTTPLFTATGTGVNLLGVSFPSGGNGWVVGSEGIIIQTGNSNCGSAVPSPCWGGSSDVLESTALTSVFEVGSNDAWAGGIWDSSSHTPSLIHWDGIKWHRAVVSPIHGTPFDIYGIFMLGGGEGWALGGNSAGDTPEALKWNGNSWGGQPITGSCGASCEPRSVYMISGGTGGDGWAVGTGGHIWRYQSGSWGLYASPTANNLFSVVISNSGSSTNAGWAVGAGGTVLVLNIVGGIPTWTATGIPGITTQNLTDVYFKDSNHGWIVGDSSTIVQTTDGGATWSGGTGQVIGAPPGTVLRSIFVDTYGTGSGNGDGWAVGDDGSAYPGNSVFAHWDGQSWTNVPLSPAISASPTGSLLSVYLTGPEDGFAVGQPVTGSLLSAIYHLDPLSPPTGGGGGGGGGGTTTATSVVTSTTSVSSSATSSTASVTTSATESSTEVTPTTTAQTSTSAPGLTVTIQPSTVQTSSTGSSVSTPMALPAIPGFPWESIIAGIVLGMFALAIVRRLRK